MADIQTPDLRRKVVKATCQESGEGAVRELAIPETCFTVYKTYCHLSVGP